MAVTPPAWKREEAILALDLYRRVGMPDQRHPEVRETSRLLKNLTQLWEQRNPSMFRNPSGVSMKLANLASLDPNQSTGLSATSQLDRAVWDEFLNDAVRLSQEAEAIRATTPDRAYWALGINAAEEDVNAAVKDGRDDWFTTKGRSITKGDRAVIWRFKGKAATRGVVALAEVTSDPEIHDFGSTPFWASPPTAPEEAVRIRYVIPEGLPRWVGDPGLDDIGLSVASSHGGTVFNMTREQWEAVIALTGETTETRFEVVAVNHPWHVVLKWRSSADPDTVEKHRSIAKGKGQVWWGIWGKPENRISARRIKRISEQLQSGVPTFAFLYGGDEEWQCRVTAFTDDPSAVDMDRFADYHKPADCVAFVLLSDFQPLERGSIASSILVASNLDPNKVVGALSNQTNPLWVVLRETGEAGEAAPAAPTMEWLVGQTSWTEERLRSLIDDITSGNGQVLLAGPPGTSKTWVAQHVAEYIAGGRPGAYKIVQFHPSYAYEDFIEGLRPVVEEGGVQFTRVDGVVLEMAKSIQDENQLHVLIIDEMNRANLPRVFGELMYLFEYRSQPIDLRYTKAFELPANLRFVGTMNTADRSIRTIDTALRRRFDVFECPADADVLARFYETRTTDVPNLIEGFVAFNAALTVAIDRHHTIGHSFFMRDTFARANLHEVWERKVWPLIEEFFFDQPDFASEFTLSRFWPE